MKLRRANLSRSSRRSSPARPTFRPPRPFDFLPVLRDRWRGNPSAGSACASGCSHQPRATCGLDTDESHVESRIVSQFHHSLEIYVDQCIQFLALTR